MGFLRKLKKKLAKTVAKGVALYGKVGIGPGSGLAAKAAPLLSRLTVSHKMGHNARAAMRTEGIGHQGFNMRMIAAKYGRRRPSRRPTRRRARRTAYGGVC